MGKNGTKVPAVCLARIRPQVRVRCPAVALPKPVPSQGEDDGKVESKGCTDDAGGGEVLKESKISYGGRRIMIVVDSSFEAKGALQWALSHTVQDTDVVTLLYVVTSSNPAKEGELSREEIPQRVDELLKSMKKLCESTKPELLVKLQVVAGKDKGPTIVEESKNKGTGILVLGQKKRSTTLRLLMIWTGNYRSGGQTVAEYCIENAPCVTIAVRRKSKKHGGYLITTKRHKDFWLLA